MSSPSVPDVSVVVPVYNAASFLNETIRSVLCQTHSNWELLLVDDGSTDGSGELCDRCAEGDPRIHAFHIPNGGFCRAKNHGIRQAAGNWIMFLDDDDLLTPAALEKMLAASTGADLVMGLYQTFPNPTVKLEHVPDGLFGSYRELSPLVKELYDPYFLISPWSKLYRRDLVKDGFSPEQPPIEGDLLFVLGKLAVCRGIRLLPEPVYQYRRGEHASHTGHFHAEWLYVYREVYRAMMELFPDTPGLEEFFMSRYAVGAVRQLCAIASLHHVSRLQKQVMIEAERENPFYQLSAVTEAACDERISPIWRAFLDRRAAEVLEMAEALIQEQTEDGSRVC